MSHFFTDPEHIWIAVVIGSGVSLASAVMFALVVYLTIKPILSRFVADQKARDVELRRESDLREKSQDTAIGIVSTGLASVRLKLERREKKDQGIARAFGLLDQRIKTIEQNPMLRRMGGNYAPKDKP